jgi:hypothetical protein
MKNMIRVLLIGFVIFLFVILLAVRFTKGTISAGETILLNYDEENGKFQFFERKTYHLNGIDGPYIIGNQIIKVTENNRIIKNSPVPNEFIVHVDNNYNDSFLVRLNEFDIPKSEYPNADNIFVISDIEGNFEAFSGILFKSGVITKNFDWNFGNGHLVLVGDFMDRGKNVLPVLWLIYKLEQQAKQQGGMVHFILGNHEILNLQGNFRSASAKYKKIAIELGKFNDNTANYKLLFDNTTVLGRWMRSKNVVEKIGNRIFVHGGLSPELIDLQLSFDKINNLARYFLKKQIHDDVHTKFVMGDTGPCWYRGFFKKQNHHQKIKKNELKQILQIYKSEQIVVGHTVVKEILTEFNHKIIAIDVKHGKKKFSSKTKALLIKNNSVFVVDASGKNKEL